VDPAAIGSWRVGDVIGIAGTSYSPDEQEIVTISSISSTTGVIGISAPLQFYHYGSNTTAKYLLYGVDIRGEVTHLSRNIKIQPNPDSATPWGC
jgi:hypothetical protein